MAKGRHFQEKCGRCTFQRATKSLQAKNKVNILNSFSFCPFLKSFKGIGNYLLNLLDLNIGKLVVGMLFPTLA